MIKTREGRPIKINGNPEHPINQGKLSNIAQAMIINLYDPQRLKEPAKRTDMHYPNSEKITWGDADGAIVSALNEANSSGKEIAILTENVVSPSYAKLLNDFVVKYPTAKIYNYNTFNNDIRNKAWQESIFIFPFANKPVTIAISIFPPR